MRIPVVVFCLAVAALGCQERGRSERPAPAMIKRASAPAPVRAMISGIAEIGAPGDEEGAEPYLAASGTSVGMTWIHREGAKRVLRFSRLADGNWSEPSDVVTGNLIDNFADFPSLLALGGERFAVAWPEKSEGPSFAQKVRIAISGDGGKSWGVPVIPYADGGKVARGFTSMVPAADGVRLFWTDGRDMPRGEGGPGSTQLRTSVIGGPAARTDQLLDERICDCCQTDAALTSNGLVVAYRDRTDKEIRDISVITFDGKTWSDPHAVHADGWQINACPVNGPQVAADGENVSVAWFTMADGNWRVYLARSTDGGKTFGDPVKVDDGLPAGRVDVVRLRSGSDVVSWVEQNGDAYEVRMREIARSGKPLQSFRVGVTGGSNASFPRMVATEDSILICWTEKKGTPRIHVVRAKLR